MKHITVDEFKAWADRIYPIEPGSGLRHYQTYGYWDNEPAYGRFSSPQQVIEFLSDSFNRDHYVLLGVKLLDSVERPVLVLTPDNQGIDFLPYDVLMAPDKNGAKIPYDVTGKRIVGGRVYYEVRATMADHCYFANGIVPAGEAQFYIRTWPNKVCGDCGRLYTGNPRQFDTSDCVYHS